jgi:hypothetical protein
MEAMPNPSVERETPVPESGERQTMLDAGDAERELGELGKRTSEEAREVADETTVETKGLVAEIPARYDEPMSAEETAKLAGNETRLIAARERMEQEVGAALAEKAEAPAADVNAMESQLRDIDRQLEEAHKKGDGNKLRELESLRTQVDDARKKAMAERAAAKPVETAPAVPEAAVVAAPQEAPAAATTAERDPAVAQKIEAMRQQKEVNLKNTGLSESMAARINADIDRDIAALEAQPAPAAESAPAVADEGPEVTSRDATPEEEAEVLEAAAETPRLALEARMRGLEAKLKNATGDEKNRLMGEMEAATKAWEAASKDEGVEVTRPRDPADVRVELPKDAPANDNAVAASPEAAAVEVAAAAAVVAATAEKEKPAAKKKDSGNTSDEPGLKAYLKEEELIAGQLQGVDADYAKAMQESEKMAEQKKMMDKQAKAADVDSGLAPGRAIGRAYGLAKDSGLLAFMEGAAEMVGAKKGSLESKMLQDLASKQEKYAEMVKDLKKKKEEIAEREAKLAAELAAIAMRRRELADVALSDPAWAELSKREDAAKKERGDLDGLEDEVQIAEAEQEEERLRLVEEEKKQAAAEGAPKAEENRDAILPPEPEGEKGPEKPEPPPEPPAAGAPPESAPPAPPASPAETKLAA